MPKNLVIIGWMNKAHEMQSLHKPTIDCTLPGVQAIGRLHPLSMAIRLLEKIMQSHNFIKEDGPRIEDELYNFTFLNLPPEHPARSDHDTFYTKNGKLLRSHVTCVQARILESRKYTPPFGIFSIGSVYRRDEDATHSPMFYQIECATVGEDNTLAHLKGHVKYMLQAFFAPEIIETRFRVSHFAFTEPSLEVDMRRKDGPWLEVMGAGMIRRNILNRCGYHGMNGIAFGAGVERLAMLKYGIKNLLDLYDNRLDFLHCFGGHNEI